MQFEMDEKMAGETVKIENMHNIIEYEEVDQERAPQNYTDEAGSSA